MNPGEWAWSDEYQEPCRIVEAEQVWGESVCRVWLSTRDTTARVRTDRLRPVAQAGPNTAARLVYAAAAARIADSLAHDTLLAPIESSVIPLPHQLLALSRAIAGDRVRYLLADEVGLGKTIEAGLIMRELKRRGLVRRTLVVAPKGLVTQWLAEMRTRFDEDFHLLIPGDFAAYRRLDPDENIWRRYEQVVCPMDAVKPVEGRRGWSRTDVAGYNRERFDDLIAAGWDLIIVDEAHRLGGSTDQVARFRLGEGLSEAAPYLLLLSATPHQGKTDAFHRIVWLLDRTTFPDPSSVSREHVRPYVIRTEKRRAIDAAGQPLFKPRYTRLVPVAWQERHARQRALYEAVTEYVRDGYNQALREKRHHIGFLMLLMQRLVTSSTRAIRSALERRLEVLQTAPAQLRLDVDLPPGEEWEDMDGQEQADTILGAALAALRDERAQVETLLDAARTSETHGPDAKAEALLDWIYRLQQEETDPALKVLLFTEFVATQEMLRDFLADRGFSVACLNGAMDLEERRRAQEAFAGGARVLISTDAGGEGLNLQFAHVVVNYDIPWNPMRLEQRIGRVDRIGQAHPVRALNLVLENTVEYRVREVLEEKLVVILEEFGVDKAADVLDSAEAGAIFDRLYAEVLLDRSAIPEKVEAVARQVREKAQATREGAALVTDDTPLAPDLARTLCDHPMPYWVERMATAYVAAFGGAARHEGDGYYLRWPDGSEMPHVVFTRRDSVPSSARVLTLEDPVVRGVLARVPRFVPGQPAPGLRFADLPREIAGWWSLWRIAAITADWRRERIIAVFLHERWPIFLAGYAPDEGGRTGEPATPYRLEFPGPVDLPFDHDDVRVYIDGLFLEGHLRPVDHPRAGAWSSTWAAVGVRLDPVADRVRKAERLLEAVAKTIPEADARHTEWLTFASRWAELLALRFAGSHLIEPRLLDRIATVRGQVDQVFTGWMTTRYGGLHNQPPLPPVMVHHLPRHLARRLVAGDAAKIALLVIDGLALDQWAAIRQEMVALRPEFRLRESAVFAWVPTLTTVSRQALFAAKPPFFFGASLHTTDREPALWTQFWADQGLSPAAVGYLRGLRDGPLTDVEDLVTHPARRAIGLVVDNVDRIMHGMELGAAGMHAQVRLWVRGGYLADLITLLLARGYEIHLTSDHGNVEATGTGRPAEGAFAEARGARARVYSSDALRRTVRQQFPDTIEWPPLGLPEDYRPLLAAGRNAFAHAGERIVAHGGIALEEVIVPHVRIESARP